MDNRTEKRKIGDIGEGFVVKYLTKEGYRILETNYLKKWGELDIIAVKDEIIHFVEVKTVSSGEFNADVNHETIDEYRAEDNVHPWKAKRLRRVIQTYLISQGHVVGREVDWQFDLVVVHLGSNCNRIDVLEDLIL